MANVQTAVDQSIQTLPDARRNEALATGTWGAFAAARGALLPAWGSRERERWLRQYDRDNWLWLWQGAASGLCNRWANAAWELQGDDDAVAYFQDVLQDAQFGGGWSRLVKQLGRDFLRHDIGAFMEVIAPGDPLAPPTGAVSGLAYLDAMRCFPTRDPEYPVIYFDQRTGKHLLHHTRVVRLYDAPDGDSDFPDVGLSALSRAISILAQQIYMGRYITQSLDDNPPPGIMVATGFTEKIRDAALARYRDDQLNDRRPEWGRQIWLYSPDPQVEIKLTPIAFSQPPDKFSYREYTELNVNALALALGVDKLDLWEITSSGLGSGAQAQIMEAKSRGRTFGAFLKELERVLNTLLPDGVDFAFNVPDKEDEQAQASAAQAYASVASIVGTLMSDDEKRQMLANQVPAIHDAITDAEGRVRRRDDVTDTASETVTATDVEVIEPDDEPAPEARSLKGLRAYKVWATTAAGFIDTWAKNIEALNSAREQGILTNANQRLALTTLRADLYRYGQEAYKSGLAQGGVIEPQLTPESLAKVQAWLADQETYIVNLIKEVAAGRVSSEQAYPRAGMWANKSLKAAYSAGERDADANGSYMWRLGDTIEHCRDCLKLNGQIHRMRTWTDKGWLPGSDKLECKGFNCRCQLVKVTGRARGRFPQTVKERLEPLARMAMATSSHAAGKMWYGFNPLEDESASFAAPARSRL